MFCHALMKYTYFDVLTNILKHMQGTWVLSNVSTFWVFE